MHIKDKLKSNRGSMIGLLGRQGLAATLGQHCPQMTQRPGTHSLLASSAFLRCVSSSSFVCFSSNNSQHFIFIVRSWKARTAGEDQDEPHRAVRGDAQQTGRQGKE